MGCGTVEVYDEVSDSWSTTGALSRCRFVHTATLLPNGEVLVAGGGNSTFPYLEGTAEIRNPATGLWRSAGSLLTARRWHTATLLPSGKVLVAGGDNYYYGRLASAELYDPVSNTWGAAASMITGRDMGFTASLLPTGRVLVAGGSIGYGTISRTELYDPMTNSWTSGPAMNNWRADHIAQMLDCGKVLIAGGYSTGIGGATLSGAEVYDPGTNQWRSATQMTAPRRGLAATWLLSGRVLTIGGNSGVLPTAETYDPVLDGVCP